MVVNWKRETCKCGACSQDTTGTGNLTRAGASQVRGVLEVTEFLFRGGFKCVKLTAYTG